MRDPQELIKRFKSRVHVLDGGLATELEKRGHDISGKLWSAQVLLDDPGAIEQLHYDYLKAGADIIITSSYQLTFQGTKEAGYTHEQAEDALWKSVEVAVKARDRFLSELDEHLPEDRKPLIAASIGPYGAYLADGSEYKGRYGLSTEELFNFHRERFELLIQSAADLVAFETIPCAEEFWAFEDLLDIHRVPAWVSFVVKYRDEAELADGMPLFSLCDQMKWMWGGRLVGTNCIPPRDAARIVNQLKNWGFLPVVYPNSGEAWDAEHRCWVGENDAEHFAEYAREWIKAGANIIGGCCRTGPEHIAQLRKLVDSL
ncbi:MAG: homocysteine S-methyltransferase [Planctomycetota bacterium]|nr:homocysteine S-methyltransferase [Planctomycetota bacterium]